MFERVIEGSLLFSLPAGDALHHWGIFNSGKRLHVCVGWRKSPDPREQGQMATKDQVRRLLSKGLSAAEIARRLNCCGGYVRETIARIKDPKREARQQAAYRIRRAAREQGRVTT